MARINDRKKSATTSIDVFTTNVDTTSVDVVTMNVDATSIDIQTTNVDATNVDATNVDVNATNVNKINLPRATTTTVPAMTADGEVPTEIDAATELIIDQDNDIIDLEEDNDDERDDGPVDVLLKVTSVHIILFLTIQL